MTTPTRYREIDVAGGPRELGRQIGEAAREEIRAFSEAVIAGVEAETGLTPREALQVAADAMPSVDRYAPHMLDEVGGMADGAGLSVQRIMLLQVRNQLAGHADAACTSFALPAQPALGLGPVVGQNWDNDPRLDRFTIVLRRRPQGRPATMTVGAAGLIAYIGLNEGAIGACLNTLPAPQRRSGVPHYFTLRGIYEASSLDDAVAAVSRAQRVMPANIMLSTPQGPADLEVTVDDVHVLRDALPNGAVTHTNHCLHPDLVAINATRAELAQSGARKRRIDEILLDDETSVDALKSSLRDHDAHPRSICRHVNDDPDSGIWQTVFSVIIEPRERRMHISRGTPCDNPYETYLLA